MKVSYIELLGNKYPLCFSLSAIEEIGETLGDMENLSEMLGSGSVTQQAKSIDKMLTALMNAGRRYCMAVGEVVPDPLPCAVADIIDLTDPSVITSIFSAISAGKEREVEAQVKNP